MIKKKETATFKQQNDRFNLNLVSQKQNSIFVLIHYYYCFIYIFVFYKDTNYRLDLRTYTL